MATPEQALAYRTRFTTPVDGRVTVNKAADMSASSRSTVERWHDKLGGPRDAHGDRIFTPAICDTIKRARYGV